MRDDGPLEVFAGTGIELDRKTLAEMAVNDADAFKKLVGLASASAAG